MPINRYISTLLLIFAVINIQAQGKKAFICGISDYPDESGFADIHGNNDEVIVKEMLIKQGYKCFSIGEGVGKAQMIRDNLEYIATNSKPNDYVFIHFSCHGQPVEDKEPFDEDDHWDEALVATDARISYQSGVYQGESHILDDELNQYFNRIRLKIGSDGFLCVVIDACHSGNASRDEDDDDNQIIRGVNIGFSENGRTFAPKINSNGCFKIESRHDYGDILILEACRAYQNNYEIEVDGKYYGSLSYYMCKVLNNKPITKNIDWVLEIKSLMQADPRLQNQNMVYEKSF